jgi:predicted phage-related endonuclease
VKQNTEEWRLARCGHVTASRVHDIVATTRSGGFTAGRKNYLAELVAERLTGTPAPTYVSAAMAYGTECEAEARFEYALAMGVEIEEVGFLLHPLIGEAGASPDGLVGADGLVEIKCPNTATHIDTLLGEKIPVEYITQMQFQMAVTGRQWCDWVSYDKRLPKHMSAIVRRVRRDDDVIEKLNAEVITFLRELAETVDLLRKRYPTPAEAA